MKVTDTGQERENVQNSTPWKKFSPLEMFKGIEYVKYTELWWNGSVEPYVVQDSSHSYELYVKWIAFCTI